MKQKILGIKFPWVLLGVPLAAVCVAALVGGLRMASAQTDDVAFGKQAVGVWTVSAVGAPFQPHVATFHPDGTMEIDNPEAGDTHTSDSMGMGPWSERMKGDAVTGKFVEINADRTTAQYVSKLVVTYSLTIKGNSFTGPAEAVYYNPDGTVQAGPYPATLNGTRVTLPQDQP